LPDLYAFADFDQALHGQAQFGGGGGTHIWRDDRSRPHARRRGLSTRCDLHVQLPRGQ
jgi:hypothetical protein